MRYYCPRVPRRAPPGHVPVRRRGLSIDTRRLVDRSPLRASGHVLVRPRGTSGSPGGVLLCAPPHSLLFPPCRRSASVPFPGLALPASAADPMSPARPSPLAPRAPFSARAPCPRRARLVRRCTRAPLSARAPCPRCTRPPRRPSGSPRGLRLDVARRRRRRRHRRRKPDGCNIYGSVSRIHTLIFAHCGLCIVATPPSRRSPPRSARHTSTPAHAPSHAHPVLSSVHFLIKAGYKSWYISWEPVTRKPVFTENSAAGPAEAAFIAHTPRSHPRPRRRSRRGAGGARGRYFPNMEPRKKGAVYLFVYLSRIRTFRKHTCA